jgi:hypothetical protein
MDEELHTRILEMEAATSEMAGRVEVLHDVCDELLAALLSIAEEAAERLSLDVLEQVHRTLDDVRPKIQAVSARRIRRAGPAPLDD